MTPDQKRPWIETPLIWSRRLSKTAGCNIYLKLENTQPSGSFKSRGMGNFVLAKSRMPSQENGEDHSGTSSMKTHFFCSSGGNAGLGCVYAAVTLACPATIVVPLSTSDYMITKLRDAGATEVIQKGASWYEADRFLNEELLPRARDRGERAVYVPPFDDPDIWTGHATMIDEIARQLPKAENHYPVVSQRRSEQSHTKADLELPDAVVCSVGGGGLLCGVMQGLDRYAETQTQTKVLAVETIGAESLAKSVEKGELITLPEITTVATTLGARTVARKAFEYAMNKEKVRSVVLSDKDAIDACRRFADDERILVEPSCGVSLAVCYTGRLREYFPHLQPSSRVVVIVCGGSGLSLDIMAGYIKKYLE